VRCPLDAHSACRASVDGAKFQPMIDSWDLHLRAEKESAKAIRT
jgi:hypothetical protein